MASFPWVLIFTDSTIASGDPGITGLTPTFTLYKKLSDLSNPTPPAITEVGGGVYQFQADPANGEIAFTVDGGSTILVPKDRFLKAIVSYGDLLQPQDHTAIVADVQSGLTAQGYTTARAPNLANLDATVSSRAAGSAIVGYVQSAMTSQGYTTARSATLDNIVSSSGIIGCVTTGLTAQGYTTARAAGLDYLNIPMSTLVTQGNIEGYVQAAMTAQGFTTGRGSNLDFVDVAISSRVATSALPANFSLLSINGSGQVTAANSVAGPTLSQIVSGVWNELISGHTTSGSFAAQLSAIATSANTAATQATTAAGYGAAPTASANATAAAGAILASGNKIATDGSGGVTLAAAGQASLITAIAGAVPTVSQIWDALVSGHTVSGSFSDRLLQILTQATNSAASAATAAGLPSPTTAQIAAAILVNSANKLTTDASGNVVLTTAYQGTLVAAIAAAVPTVAAIWNELIAGHTTTGSFAAELAAILTQATGANTQATSANTQATNAAGSAATAAGYGKAPTVVQIAAGVPTLAQIIANLPSLAQILADPSVPLANDSNGALPANNLITGLLDLANSVETGVTIRLALKYIAAALAGVSAGGGTNNVQYDAIGNSGTVRIDATVDGNGDRTGVTLS